MDVESFRTELKQSGVSSAKVERCIEILRRIYIGENIRSEGVLQSDFEGFDEEINILRSQDAVQTDNWYSHELFRVTEKGRQIVQEILEELFDEKKTVIKSNFQHAGHIVPFLVYDYIDGELSFPKHRNGTRDWRQPLLEEERVWQARTQLFEALVQADLCIEVHHYVSTRGGELRGKHYVISEEVRDFLQGDRMWGAYHGGLVEQDKRDCELYRILRRAANHLDPENVEESRERFWEQVEESSVSESRYEEVINAISDDATTSYRGVLSDELPFEILNESKYQIEIKKHLIEPIVENLFHNPESISEENRQLKELRENGIPENEIEALEVLAEAEHDSFPNVSEQMRLHSRKAVELYQDEHWSECLLRINNVCENLVKEVYFQRGEEFEKDINVERLLDDNHRSRIEALRSATFLSENHPLRPSLESVHLERISSDAPHGSGGKITRQDDVRRVIHLCVKAYFDIDDLLE